MGKGGFMDGDQDKHLNITHAVVNTLTAGYQGKYAWLNVFKQLSSPAFNQAVFAETKGILDEIAVWIRELMSGRPVLAGPDSESREKERALDLLAGLRDDVSWLAAELLKMRSLAYPAHDPEQTELLVASLSRHAYARDHYVKGLVAYSEKFGYEEAADRWRQHLLYTPQEINLAHTFLSRLRQASGLTQKFYVDLYEETLLIPYVFRCQVQDMNRVASFYASGFSFGAAGIPDEEAAQWAALGLGPESACYWHAYGFGPDEAAAWAKAGFGDPGAAGGWKYRELGPSEAGKWRDEGFDARAASVSIMLGQTDPAEARSWKESAEALEQGSPE
jgi:hypothetical protein